MKILMLNYSDVLDGEMSSGVSYWKRFHYYSELHFCTHCHYLR